MDLPNKIKVAYYVAYCAHKGQKDKADCDYINHCIAVSDGVNGEKEKIIALLHDVLEDTKFSEKDLRILFGDEIVDVLLILKYNPSAENYFDYIKRIKRSSELAKTVKLADLKHNSDLSRLPAITEKDIVRKEKYQKAIQILSSD